MSKDIKKPTAYEAKLIEEFKQYQSDLFALERLTAEAPNRIVRDSVRGCIVMSRRSRP